MDLSDGPSRVRGGYGSGRSRERPYDNRRPDEGKRQRGNYQSAFSSHFNGGYYSRGGGRFYHDLDDFSGGSGAGSGGGGRGRRDGRGGSYRRGRNIQRGSWGRNNNTTNSQHSNQPQRRQREQELPDTVQLVTEFSACEDQQKLTTMSLDQDKLYTGSKDGKVKVWSLTTGQCTAAVDVGGEVDSLMVEGGFLIVGMHDEAKEGIIKVWNMATGAEHKLTGHRGQVLCLAASLSHNCLYSGGQDCSLRVWGFNTQAMIFFSQDILTTQAGGHAKAVNAITVAGQYLFSGDLGGWIKVWDLAQNRCTQTIQNAHQNAVMKLLVWESNYLLSGSLDGTVKAWGPKEMPIAGAIVEPEAIYTQSSWDEEENQQGGRPRRYQQRVMTMHATMDAAQTPILMVSLDRAVKLYGLPGFEYKGSLQQEHDVTAITTVPGMLLMTGDDHGKLKWYQWRGAVFPAVTEEVEATMA